MTDAILADPARGGDIDVIDIRKWFYREDGTVFAPEGGQSLTWRQYVRLNMPAKSNFQGIYSAVREYRDKYPDKAVVYNADLGNERILGEWAVLIAGGSLAKIPAVNHPDFGAGFAAMKPVAVDPSKQWGLGAAGTGYLFYGANGAVTLDLPGDNASYVMRWIDPATGAVTVAGRVKSGQTLKTPEKPAILWLNKK